MRRTHHSFQYKTEENDSVQVSTAQNDKVSTLIIWLCCLCILTVGIFIFSYQSRIPFVSKNSSYRKTSSIYHVDIDPFLIRVITSNGVAISKIKTRFFVNDIRVQTELEQNQTKFKEYLIFFLSNVSNKTFLDSEKKRELQDKVKNKINDFLSNGQIQEIEINSQFI